MNILLIVDAYPAPDRNSADFRLCRLLGMLTEDHAVTVAVLGEARQTERIGADAVASYRRGLVALGAEVASGGIDAALGARAYGAVVFEWHFPAVALLQRVRLRQPQARVIVDSVDVVFNRLEAKARVSGAAEDAAHAQRTRAVELDVYRRADLVVTVTDADAQILQRHLPQVATYTIPNIHPLEPLVEIEPGHRQRLLFVGSYARPGGETNIDAMRWFCSEVLPLIAAQEPRALLRIVGGPRVAEIDALASPHVEVLGFVPQTRPYLQSSGVSVAPLRFGGGMKGKVGEAMSYGLPVVSTSTGVEGFGLEPGVHALVGDTAQEFAGHVLALLADRDRLEAVRRAGYEFICEHYSDVAVGQRVRRLFADIGQYGVQRPKAAARALDRVQRVWDRHLGWRLGR